MVRMSSTSENRSAQCSDFVEDSNRCRCTCHCATMDALHDNIAVPSSPQKSHGIFVTLRKKFSQIMKWDVHEPHSNDSVRTLPRTRSTDRASGGRSGAISRSRTMPRKGSGAHGTSMPSTPGPPPERGSDASSLCRGRSFHRHSSKAQDVASFSATLSPSRLHQAVCCFKQEELVSVVDDRVVPSTSDILQPFSSDSGDKLAVSGAMASAVTQDTGYGHTWAPGTSDAVESLPDDVSGALGVAPFYDQVKESVVVLSPGWSLTRELHKLPKYGWYWGPIARSEAEERLSGQPDGAFLLRDSSDDRYLLSLSFRSDGRTLHTRIEHCNGLFSFYSQPESEGYKSIVELIERSMSDSQSGVFCYSRARTPGSPSFPVRLARPVSRFTQVRSLQYLCRFVIRQHTRIDYIQRLPLPSSIRGWLEETQY